MDNTKIKKRYFPIEFIYLIKRGQNTYDSSIELEDKGNTKMVAHRGLSGIHRENTVASFTAAGKLSYFGIETDVHRTKDGAFVIIHDDTTGRVAEGVNISVEGSCLSELTGIKLKAKNGEDTPEATTIPLLSDYINVCKSHGKTAVLELKNHFEPSDVYAIIDIIKEIGYLDNTIFISFDMPNLEAVKEKYPAQAVQYLTTRWEKDLAERLADKNMDLDIYWRELNAERIEILHKAGVKINCWTVDSVAFAKKLIGWGVDYITSNILE